ncbi:MAG TPA: protein kinase [Gemmatimonadales bacterium]|nr:protein kinase [Gemmatimonadales bacterium]
MPDTVDLEGIREALKGRYRIERLLGEGGMATVYLAQDERHDRRVAVKVLRPELAQTIGVERFHREIGIAARLNHPHILPLLDSGTLDLGPGRPASAYYVMPYVQGESLRDRLLREQKLPLPEALRLAREVADALDHAHRHGVIHRDIKPENILLSEQHAVVADFGIARALDEAGAGSGGTLTRAGQAIGTPTYMSPEQITGERSIDGRTDLYALGCTLFEMLTGQPPWSGGGMTSVLARRLAEPPPKVRTLDPSIPTAVEQALLKTLAREPEERYKTPAEFAAALETSGELRALPERTRRRRTVLLVGAAVLAVAVFGLTRLVRVGHADAITSLAITPREDAQGDTALAYLTEGVQEGVADLLRRLPQLRVTAPSQVAQLRRLGLTYEELGQRLKVGAIVTLRLRRTGDSVGVQVELLRIPGAALIWSQRYARPAADLALIQGEVAKLLADSLRLQLTGVERATIDRRPTTSAAAYELYLRGRQFQNRGSPLGAREAASLMDSALHYARQAIAIDSNFAAPYGLLSTYYFVSAFRGLRTPFGPLVDSGAVLARQALARDSTIGDGWLNLITHAIYLDDDVERAGAAVHAALRLNPHDSQALQYSAIYVGEWEGRLDSALVLMRRSVELEPSLLNQNSLGDLYMRTRKYDSAVAVLRRAMDLDPSVAGPRRRLITSLEHLKRYEEAIEVRRLGGDTAGAAVYAQTFKEGGAAGYERAQRADLEGQLKALIADSTRPYELPRDTVPPLREGRIAGLYAQLGEWSKAMDWVEREYQRRPHRFRLFVTNPDFHQLRSDPRFQALVRKEGLETLLSR